MSVTAEALRSRRLGYEDSDGTMPATVGGLKLLQDVVGLALKLRLRFFGALLGPPAIAVLLVLLLPPVYRAQIVLMVSSGHEQPAQQEGGAALTGSPRAKKQIISAEVALLSNPELVETSVTRMGVANLYPDLSTARFGPQLARDTAIRRFETALRVEPESANTIRVSFDHSNGRMAARALDQFIVSYQDLHARVFTGRAASGYEQRLAGDMKELGQLEHERADTSAALGLLDVGKQRAVLTQQRAEAEQRLRQTIDRADALSKRLAYLAQTRPTIGPDMPNPAATRAAELLVDLRQKEALLLATYDSQNPQVRRVREQIAEAQKQLSDARTSTGRSMPDAASGVSATAQELAATQAELSPLKAQQSIDTVLLAVISQKLQRLDGAEAQLGTIDAKIAEQNEKLQSILRLYNKASKDDETDQANLTTVVQASNAATLDEPVFPNKLLLLGGGVAIGMLAAASVIAYAMSARRKSIDAYGLLLGLPVQDMTSARVRGTRRIEK